MKRLRCKKAKGEIGRVLPRVDPVAYNDRNEIILPDVVRIASQINIDA